MAIPSGVPAFPAVDELEAWLGVNRGGEARLWLAEQGDYDVWQAEQRFKAKPMQVQSAP